MRRRSEEGIVTPTGKSDPMEQSKVHSITVKITGVDPFKLPVKENEESFYRSIIERINGNCENLIYGASGDKPAVALAKVALYYADMLYRQTKQLQDQRILLADFEARLDRLLSAIE